MTVPKYHEFMLPLLKLASDGHRHKLSDAYSALADEFNLTDEERKELLPSGKQVVYKNRIGWARTYLKKAGLLVSNEKGSFEITDRGTEIVNENPREINQKLLMRFPEFQQFKSRSDSDERIEPAAPETDKTPKDLIEENFLQIMDSLSEDLLEQIKSASDSFFEKLVVDLLLKMGYGGSRRDAGKAIGKSGDQGIDGIINEDKLGLDVIYIQAKKYNDNKVSSGDIRNFIGSLDLKNANKGVFLTTSLFTDGAQETASKCTKRVILIDGIRLANLMIEHNLAVSPEDTYEIKQIDYDYFEDA